MRTLTHGEIIPVGISRLPWNMGIAVRVPCWVWYSTRYDVMRAEYVRGWHVWWAVIRVAVGCTDLGVQGVK
jgi:hypothetical protein